MGKEELEITKLSTLSTLVELNNENVHQLVTTPEYRDSYLTIIAKYEGGQK